MCTHRVCTNRVCTHCFCSYQGLPERWREGRGGGFFDRGGALPPVAPNVNLHVGWFDATLPAFLRGKAAAAKAEAEAGAGAGAEVADAAASAAAGKAAVAAMAAVATAAAREEEPLCAATARLRACFVHIDCDLYSSTKTVLTLLAPAIRTGTASMLKALSTALLSLLGAPQLATLACWGWHGRLWVALHTHWRSGCAALRTGIGW